MDATRVHLFSLGSYLCRKATYVNNYTRNTRMCLLKIPLQTLFLLYCFKSPPPFRSILEHWRFVYLFPQEGASEVQLFLLYQPFNYVKTWDPVLSTNCVQVTAQHRDPHTGPARAGGCHITAPLVSLGVIPWNEHKRAALLFSNDTWLEEAEPIWALQFNYHHNNKDI